MIKMHTKHGIIRLRFLSFATFSCKRRNLHGPGRLGKAKLSLVLILAGHAGEVVIDAAGLGVGAEGSAEEEDVRLGAVEGVVHPASGLLDADATPLSLGLLMKADEK